MLIMDLEIDEQLSMITVEMRVFATGSRQDEIVRTIRWLMGQIEAGLGLEETDLYRSVDREDKVVLVQRWRTFEDLRRYVLSDEFVRLLEVLDLSEAPPQLHFDMVSKRRGLELVEALRCEESVNVSE